MLSPTTTTTRTTNITSKAAANLSNWISYGPLTVSPEIRRVSRGQGGWSWQRGVAEAEGSEAEA